MIIHARNGRADLCETEARAAALGDSWNGGPGCEEEFYPCVMAIFRRKGLSAEDAQDLAQETYLKALKNARRRGSLGGTPAERKNRLAKMAASVLQDFRKKEWGRGKRKRPRAILFSAFEKAVGGEEQDRLELDALARSDDEAARREWLEVLDKRGGTRLAEIVRLREERYSEQEVADRLGLKVRTVQRKLRQAREIVVEMVGVSRALLLWLPGRIGVGAQVPRCAPTLEQVGDSTNATLPFVETDSREVGFLRVAS